MKAISKILIFGIVYMSAACSDINTPNNGHVTQKITSRSDCESCSDRWKWSNGVASIDWFEGLYHYSERGFSIKTKVPGELTMDAKLKDADHSSWVTLIIDDHSVKSSGYLENKEYEKVSLGQVDKDIVVWVAGSNVVIKDIMLTDTTTPDSPWDF